MTTSALRHRRHPRQAGRIKQQEKDLSEASITRHEEDNHGEYRAHVEGSPAIGRLTWVQRDGVRVAEHTLVPPVIGNRGVAAQLVEALIADAREKGFKVRPDCSYVAAAFKRHPEWADLHA
jgi:predicted GNAT family acetyltransferase